VIATATIWTRLIGDVANVSRGSNSLAPGRGGKMMAPLFQSADLPMHSLEHPIMAEIPKWGVSCLNERPPLYPGNAAESVTES